MNFEVVMAYVVIGLIAGLAVWQTLRIKAKERESDEKERQMLANMTAEEQAAYWKEKYEKEKKQEKLKDKNPWSDITTDPACSNLPGNAFYFDSDFRNF